jgi:hypothetical protein
VLSRRSLPSRIVLLSTCPVPRIVSGYVIPDAKSKSDRVTNRLCRSFAPRPCQEI